MKAYIFDMDGTLLDSLYVWKQIDIDFLKKRGFELPPDFAAKVSSMSYPEAAEYTICRFGLTCSVEELLREWHSMAVYAYGNTVQLKPHAREYLEKLKACGAKLAIATSLPAALYEPALRNHGIEDLFDAFCSTDEVSFGKTRPDVFLLAAEKLGVSPEDCIVFEDVVQAIQSAKSVGMTVYGVYDEASKDAWPDIKQIADGTLLDFGNAALPD